MTDKRQTIRTLGFAGLIPFVLAAMIPSFAVDYTMLAFRVAEAYAFGIICFLCGSWWGLALHNGSRKTLLLSILYFLTAFCAFTFAEEWWALTAAILLIGAFLTELNTSLNGLLPYHYRDMRVLLTLVAGSSMLVVHLLR